MKTTPPSHRVWIFGLLLVYLGSRMTGLLSMPIFLDEAIHIMSAKAAVSGHPLAGAELGKWLSVQFYGFTQRLFGESLFFARLVPVVLGALTVVLLFALGRRFGRRSGNIRALFSALLYVTLPFSLFYDRVALSDQFLVVLLALVILLTFRVIEEPNRFNQLMLGAAVLLSPLFKLSGILFVPVPAVIALIVTSKRRGLPQFLDVAPSYLVSIPGIVLFGLFAAPIGESDKLVSLRPIDRWLERVSENAEDVLALFWSMLTPALFLGLAIGCLALSIVRVPQVSRRRVLAQVAVLILVAGPYILFFDVWYPRYFLPLLVPLCVVGGEVSVFVAKLSNASRRSVAPVLLRMSGFLVLALAAAQSLSLLVAPRTFSYDPRVRSQFVTGWTSGHGLQGAIGTIRQLSRRHSQGVRIVRSPWEDMPLQGLDVFIQDREPRVEKVTLYPWEDDAVVSQLSELLTDGTPTYLLFNSGYPYSSDREVIERIRISFDILEVAHFVKPGSQPGLRIWRVDGEPDRTPRP